MGRQICKKINRDRYVNVSLARTSSPPPRFAVAPTECPPCEVEAAPAPKEATSTSIASLINLKASFALRPGTCWATRFLRLRNRNLS